MVWPTSWIRRKTAHVDIWNFERRYFFTSWEVGVAAWCKTCWFTGTWPGWARFMWGLWILWPHGPSSKRNWQLGASPSEDPRRVQSRGRKGSGLAMYVQNDACFHARQGLQHRIVQIKWKKQMNTSKVMTRRFEPPTSLEQILARACWIACNQRRLHYDLLTPVQWALESFSSKDSQEAPAQSKDKVGERNPSHFNWCSIPISSPSAWY